MMLRLLSCLGCSVLLIGLFALGFYYFLDIDDIQCKISNLLVEQMPAQEQVEATLARAESFGDEDVLLWSNKGSIDLRMRSCGCRFGSYINVYGSDRSIDQVIARYSLDRDPWKMTSGLDSLMRVIYTNPPNRIVVNFDHTTSITRLKSIEGWGIVQGIVQKIYPTIYWLEIYYAAPSTPGCFDAFNN